MARELKLTAIILKKQPFKEGDEIITLFTKELGKIRAIAKSVKSPKSKMQQKLQALFLAEIMVTQGKLPQIIGAEPIKVFGQMRENLEAMKIAFYALELVLKLTADEQKNEPLFNLLRELLELLDREENQEILNLGLLKFKIEILEVSGLGVNQLSNFDSGQKLYFSFSKGGFAQEKVLDVLSVSLSAFKLFASLSKSGFADLGVILTPIPGNHQADEGSQNGSVPIHRLSNEPINGHATSDIYELQNLLSQFIEYQLERKIKSEKYLRQGNMV